MINIIPLLKKNKSLFAILVFALLIRTIYFFDYHELLWDEGVYIGMGKYIFSLGSAGLWEHIRPVVLPILLGFGWFININPVLFGRVVELLFSLGIILLSYLIALHFLNKKTAILTALLLSFSGIFLYMSNHIYTEIPSLFFILLGTYLLLKKKPYFAGLSLGVSFLTKFPSGIFILPLSITLLIDKRLRAFAVFLLGFLTSVIPYLLLNRFLYGSALAPLVQAGEVITKVLGCNILRQAPWWHYLYYGIKDNVLNIFSLVGIFFLLKNFKKYGLTIILSLIFPLVYFTQLHCRDFRYMLVFLPFLLMLSAYGIVEVISFFREKLKNRGAKQRMQSFIILIATAVSLFQGIYFYHNTESNFINEKENAYLTFLENKPVAGEIWSSNPVVSLYTDAKVNKIYYPVYNSDVSAGFFKYLTENSVKMDYVFLDNCGGGIICHPDDALCKEQTGKTTAYLNKNFKKAYYTKWGKCYYAVYTH